MGYQKRHFYRSHFKLESVPIEGQIGAGSQVTRPRKRQHTSHMHSYTKQQPAILPKGLIGAKCTAQVIIGGQDCGCLLDTGSQVTTIPESFHQEYLSHLPILSLNNLLEVEGANGQSVPYLGYVETTIKFPRCSLGVDIEVPTLALIVPDMRSSLSSLLVGTNTLDVLYEQYTDTAPQNNHSLPYGYNVIFKTLEVRFQPGVGEITQHGI